MARSPDQLEKPWETLATANKALMPQSFLGDSIT